VRWYSRFVLNRTTMGFVSRFRFLLNSISWALFGLILSPAKRHHSSTIRIALATGPADCFWRPCTGRPDRRRSPASFNFHRRPSTTRLHSRGERTPPCGQPRAATNVYQTPWRAAQTRLRDSMNRIHPQRESLKPRSAKALQITSKGVLSKISPANKMMQGRLF